jgi:hypothetical protein
MINSIPSTDQRKRVEMLERANTRKMQRGDHEPRDQLFSESRIGAPFSPCQPRLVEEVWLTAGAWRSSGPSRLLARR